MPQITNDISARNHNVRMIRFMDKYGMERSTAISNEKKLTRNDIIALIEFSGKNGIIDLENRDISNLDLHGLNFNGCSFRNAFAVGTIFDNSNLASTDFENAHIFDSSTVGSNLEHSNMQQAGIKFSTKREDYLSLARRREAELTDHYFGIFKINIRRDSNGVDILSIDEGIKATRNIIRKLLHVSKERSAIANLSGRDMSLLNLSGLDFSNVLLTDSILTCGLLIMSNFDNAVVNGAYLNANITGAKIMNIRGVHKAKISGLQTDNKNYLNIARLLERAVNNGEIERANMKSKMDGVILLPYDQQRAAMLKYEQTLEEDKRYQI